LDDLVEFFFRERERKWKFWIFREKWCL